MSLINENELIKLIDSRIALHDKQKQVEPVAPKKWLTIPQFKQELDKKGLVKSVEWVRDILLTNSNLKKFVSSRQWWKHPKSESRRC